MCFQMFLILKKFSADTRSFKYRPYKKGKMYMVEFVKILKFMLFWHFSLCDNTAFLQEKNEKNLCVKES